MLYHIVNHVFVLLGTYPLNAAGTVMPSQVILNSATGRTEMYYVKILTSADSGTWPLVAVEEGT